MGDLIMPGMIGLTQISGWAGRAIDIGQLLNGDGLTGQEHAFVLLPVNMILEAEPGGARIVPLHYTNVHWCQGIYRLLPRVTADQLDDAAEQLKGIPYAFLDYPALGAHRLGVNTDALQRYIESTGHEICSQLVDHYYQLLGGHIFDDGRWPGFVTPGMLYQRDLQLAGAA
jgi:hypothetical protein